MGPLADVTERGSSGFETGRESFLRLTSIFYLRRRLRMYATMSSTSVRFSAKLGMRR